MKPAVVLLTLGACSHEMHAQLESGEGLAPGATVVMHGSTVGTVTGVELRGGAAPITVSFDVDDAYASIRSGACATSNDGQLELHADRGLQPVEDDNIVACPTTIEESIVDLVGGTAAAATGVLEAAAAEAASRAAARNAAESLRGAAEGLREALGENGARDIGRILGEQARELIEGASEGANGMPEAPLPPPPAP